MACTIHVVMCARVTTYRYTCAHHQKSKIHTHHDYIVPGFNEFAKQLHSEARGDYLLWKASGKPSSGLCKSIVVESYWTHRQKDTSSLVSKKKN